MFAIAITLLVLDLKVPRALPSEQLRAALLEQWPSYVSFLASFGGYLWGPATYITALLVSIWAPALSVALCGAVGIGFALAPRD